MCPLFKQNHAYVLVNAVDHSALGAYPVPLKKVYSVHLWFIIHCLGFCIPKNHISLDLSEHNEQNNIQMWWFRLRSRFWTRSGPYCSLYSKPLVKPLRDIWLICGLFVQFVHHLKDIVKDRRTQVEAEWKATVLILLLSRSFVTGLVKVFIPIWTCAAPSGAMSLIGRSIIPSLVPILFFSICISCLAVQQGQRTAFLPFLGVIVLVVHRQVRGLFALSLVQIQTRRFWRRWAGQKDVLLTSGTL